MSRPTTIIEARRARDCYGRLACAVIGEAVKDYFGHDPMLKAEAVSFFFSRSKAWTEMRHHWFAQAGMSVPPRDQLLSDLLRWNREKP